MDYFSVVNKNIIITGASSGIGRACAIVLSNMGANLFLFGRDEKKLDDTKKMLNDQQSHKTFVVDLTNFKLVENVFTNFKESSVKFHGLVNSAGVTSTMPLRGLSMLKVKSLFEINVMASLNISKIFSKKCFIDKSGANIIFISSVMASVGEVGKTSYSMSKGALKSAVKSLSIELAPKNIRVNSISPGVVRSPMSEKSYYSRSNESLQKIIEKHPLGIGDPDDVAKACAFLLSDASKWITGIDLVVDGGYLAK